MLFAIYTPLGSGPRRILPKTLNYSHKCESAEKKARSKGEMLLEQEPFLEGPVEPIQNPHRERKPQLGLNHSGRRGNSRRQNLRPLPTSEPDGRTSAHSELASEGSYASGQLRQTTQVRGPLGRGATELVWRK